MINLRANHKLIKSNQKQSKGIMSKIEYPPSMTSPEIISDNFTQLNVSDDLEKNPPENVVNPPEYKACECTNTCVDTCPYNAKHLINVNLEYIKSQIIDHKNSIMRNKAGLTIFLKNTTTCNEIISNWLLSHGYSYKISRGTNDTLTLKISW